MFTHEPKQILDGRHRRPLATDTLRGGLLRSFSDLFGIDVTTPLERGGPNSPQRSPKLGTSRSLSRPDRRKGPSDKTLGDMIRSEFEEISARYAGLLDTSLTARPALGLQRVQAIRSGTWNNPYRWEAETIEENANRPVPNFPAHWRRWEAFDQKTNQSDEDARGPSVSTQERRAKLAEKRQRPLPPIPEKSKPKREPKLNDEDSDESYYGQ